VLLEDGTVFPGKVFAGEGDVMGEVVFNTAMTGYQEVLTDPSYKEQVLVMTYPLIGNYGINEEDVESRGIHLEGFIVREYCHTPSNWRSRKTLKDYLEEYGKIGIEGIDTRALTRRLRTKGSMRGIVSTRVDRMDELKARLDGYPGLVGRDIVCKVTGHEPFIWHRGVILPMSEAVPVNDCFRVVVQDCGVKYNILRSLDDLGCEVYVVPSKTGSEEILSLQPDGVMLSNGPGDPEPLKDEIRAVQGLIGKVPVFGICLGHQILGQALGARTEKLKFGHHGANQPVKNLMNGRVEITSQNHGFVVVAGTLPRDAQVTHINLNDNTLEGIRYPSQNAFSVQYHPEAAPGPHDAHYLFEEFICMMREHRKRAA
jgi:carbamoyl-phosphate synthase small subunit